jgi:hypothetical protein
MNNSLQLQTMFNKHEGFLGNKHQMRKHYNDKCSSLILAMLHAHLLSCYQHYVTQAAYSTVEQHTLQT